jgi:hypothetical protein
MKTTLRLARWAPAAALLLTMPAAVASAQQTGAPAAEKSPGEAVEAPAAPMPAMAAGMVIARDPETGELRAPTAAELAELASGWDAMYDPEGLESVIFPDGTEMVDLQGRYLLHELAVTDARGDRVHRCSSEPQVIRALLEASASHEGDTEEARDDRQ